jgi:hypothetical protein
MHITPRFSTFLCACERGNHLAVVQILKTSHSNNPEYHAQCLDGDSCLESYFCFVLFLNDP